MRIAQCPFVNVNVTLAQLGFEPMARVRVRVYPCACACVVHLILLNCDESTDASYCLYFSYISYTSVC